MRSEEKPQLQAAAAEEDWSGHTQTHKEAKKEAKTGETVPNVQQQKEQKTFPTFTLAEESKPVAEKSYSEIIEEKAQKYQEDKQNVDRLNTMGYSVAFGLLDHLTTEEADKLSKENEEAKKSSNVGVPVVPDATAEEVKEKSERYFPMGYSPAFGLYNDDLANKTPAEQIPEKAVEPLKEFLKEEKKLPENKETGVEKIAKKIVEARDKTETVIEEAVDAVAKIPEVVAKEVKEFRNAVVLTAEDVKDSIVGPAKQAQTDLSIKAAEFRKEADKKLEEAKEKGKDLKVVGEELKRDAEVKGKELKGAIQAKGEELKEAAKAKAEELKKNAEKKLEEVKNKSKEELSSAERNLIGGKPEEGKVTGSLKRTEVAEALKDSHHQHENDPGSVGRFVSYIFWPFKNPSTDETLEEDEMNAQSIDRINSIAYSPAGALYDKEMLRHEHEQEHKQAPRTLGVIAAAEKQDNADLQVPHYGPVSSVGSYYQSFDGPIPKAEVEERVLEQTIDFFL